MKKLIIILAFSFAYPISAYCQHFGLTATGVYQVFDSTGAPAGYMYHYSQYSATGFIRYDGPGVLLNNSIFRSWVQNNVMSVAHSNIPTGSGTAVLVSGSWFTLPPGSPPNPEPTPTPTPTPSPTPTPTPTPSPTPRQFSTLEGIVLNPNLDDRSVTIVSSTRGVLQSTVPGAPNNQSPASFNFDVSDVLRGEYIEVYVQGVLVFTHQFSVELFEDIVMPTYTIPLFVAPSPTPTPFPTPSPTPIFSPTPTPNPSPTPTPTVPPQPTPPDNPEIPPYPGDPGDPGAPNNPFTGSNDVPNADINKSDLYDAFRQALDDSYNAAPPSEVEIAELPDYTDEANGVLEQASEFSTKVVTIGEKSKEIVILWTNIFRTLQMMPFPGVDKVASHTITLPVLGSFTFTPADFPFTAWIRTVFVLFLALMTLIYSIHIIRKAIA